jgi:hypothetical protein
VTRPLAPAAVTRCRHGRDSEPSRVVGTFVHGITKMGAARSRSLRSIKARSRTSSPASVSAARTRLPARPREQGRAHVRELSFSDPSLRTDPVSGYAVLSIFPALLALVSILGVIRPSVTQPLIDNLSTVAPGPAKDPACCRRVSDCGRRSSDSR